MNNLKVVLKTVCSHVASHAGVLGELVLGRAPLKTCKNACVGD